MLKNYFISAFRSFLKTKMITSINLVGLTVGLILSILLIVLINYEYSYDEFHDNINSIYRVLSISQDEGQDEKNYYPFVPSALGEFIKTSIPELEDRVTVTAKGPKMKVGETLYDETSLYADNNFLRIFSFDVVRGNKQNALSEQNSIVLTKSFASKLFGSEDPLNQLVVINKQPYQVTAIIKDVPANSSVQFSALLSINSFSIYKMLINEWGNNLAYVYLNLPPQFDKDSFESQLNNLTKPFDRPGVFAAFAMQPFSRIHLYTHNDFGFSLKDFGISGEGNINNLIIYTFFVFFILFTAIINYTNISFNQISDRTKEIGMRRILGASKIQIVIKSWLESVIICSASLILCITTIYFVLPDFNNLISRKIEFSTILQNSGEVGIVLLVVTILLGLVPAWKLIKASSPQLLKKELNFVNRHKSVKGMLGIQFATAFFFLTTAFLITNQIGFINSKYNINDEEDIIQIRNGNSENNGVRNASLFFNAVTENNMIIDATYNDGYSMKSVLKWDNFEVNNKKEMCYLEMIEKRHFSMYNIRIVAGRALDLEKFPSDTVDAIMVNESFVKIFDLKNPIGTLVSASDKNYRIIGVFEDYALFNLKMEIKPLVLMHAKKISDFYFKVSKQNIAGVLNMMKEKWNEYYPNEIFSYSFYNETVLKDYNDELIAQRVFIILALVSISLSILGVIGLSSLILIRKKKEIAIRKILGASIHNLIVHFSKEFIVTIIISYILSSILSEIYINRFLEDFVYKVTIDSAPFILSLVLVTTIVFLSIAIQALKSLFVNPALSLRINE